MIGYRRYFWPVVRILEQLEVDSGVTNNIWKHFKKGIKTIYKETKKLNDPLFTRFFMAFYLAYRLEDVATTNVGSHRSLTLDTLLNLHIFRKKHDWYSYGYVSAFLDHKFNGGEMWSPDEIIKYYRPDNIKERIPDHQLDDIIKLYTFFSMIST